MERWLPPDAPDIVASEGEVTRRAALLALAALGVARAPHIRAHFTRGRYPDLPQALEALEAGGEIVRVAVDGLGDDWWMRAADAERDGDFRGRTALLSPFDNLIWTRDRTERLFGTRVRLEIYTPAHKRTHGYYVLPFLEDEAITARVDLKSDRQAGVLRVQAAWREPDATADTASRLAAELRKMSGWLGLDGVEVAGKGDLAAALESVVSS